VGAIEAAVACGQIEELIEQAEDEYDLCIAMNETIKPWEADPEGDAAFAEYHPSFGQTKADFDLNTADEADTFKEVDEQLGLPAIAAASQSTDPKSVGSGAGTTVAGVTSAKQ
jgi:hypothetical protein